MRLQAIAKELCTITSNKQDLYIDCLKAYSIYKRINYSNNIMLNNLLKNCDKTVYEKIEKLFQRYGITLNDLALLFQFFWDEDNIKKYGIVYTDTQICEFIINSAINKINKIGKICDPACGSGIFLLTAIQIFHTKFNLDLEEICTKYLFGFDIKDESIIQSQSLIYFYLLEQGFKNNIQLNIFKKNSLNINHIEDFKNKFTYIVGNPPYVRAKNIPNEIKKDFIYWKTSKDGNPDLYIPFYELGLYMLNDKGILGYISPNTFIQSVNGRSLRFFLTIERYDIDIIDFRDAQLFKNVTSYTCIILINSALKNNNLYYSRVKKNINDLQKTLYQTTNFIEGKPWRLGSQNVDKIVYKIEHSGKQLNDWKIRNGLATLKNDLFIFTPIKSDEKYYYREYDNKIYKIEKEICIKIAKPNIMKNEKDLMSKIEYGIFPYIKTKEVFNIIDEDRLKNTYPFTYEFLNTYKNVLNERDKGKGKYPAWYAYGRTQGMNNQGKKLLIPYLSTEPIAIVSLDEELLFYCGYAIFSDSIEELKILKIFLESEVFWYYIKHTSKPYSKGSRAFAKNYIKNFSIPSLSKEEIEYILNEENVKKRNEWIMSKYKIKQLIEDS